MDRRLFISGGGAAAGLFLAGCAGREAEPSVDTTTQQQTGIQGEPVSNATKPGYAAEHIGVSLGDHFQDAANIDRIEDYVELAAGVGDHIRYDFVADAPEAWSVHDRVITAASSWGLGVIGLVLGADNDPARLADYSSQVAKRYGSAAGGPVRTVEVLNEVNLGPIPVKPEDYAKLFVNVSGAVLSTDSGIKVITSGLAGKYEESDIDPVEYIQSMLGVMSADQLRAVGGIGLHLYCYGGAILPSQDASDTWSRVNTRLPAVLTNYFGSPDGVGLYITEAGSPTGNPMNEPWLVGVDETFQSTTVAEIMTLPLAGMVTPSRTVYELVDHANRSGSQEGSFGLFHADLTPKPAAAHLLNWRNA